MKQAITRYSASRFTWQKDTRCFSAYVSELPNAALTEDIIIYSDVPAGEITFRFTHADMDATKEDTYGWNYKAVKGAKFPCTLLIIND